MNWFLAILIIFKFIKLCENLNSICVSKENCKDCIQENCVWCSKMINPNQKFEGSFIRCQSPSEANTLWCPIKYMISPQPKLQIIQNYSLNSFNGSDFMHLQPQHIHLTLRRGQVYNIDMYYSQTRNYPVDLYYLMDLSMSMADDKDKLSKLSGKLSSEMSNLTNDLRMGFGSFIDKVTLPFVSTIQAKILKPCTLPNGDPCIPPYSFQNHLSLTKDTEQFLIEVEKAGISGNLDVSEGGFDSIMQVIVCTDEIGWREKARHLLIFSTDAGFHFGGDGKLAGIIEPHDGKCYLNENGQYYRALDFDYPTISQINRVAIKHNINIIFAVTKKQADLYKDLKEQIHGAEFGILTHDSSNIVELIRGIYNKITDTVTMTDNSDDDVEIRYFSSCLNGQVKETDQCSGLHNGNRLKFTLSIKALHCPANNDSIISSKTIKIKPRAIDDSLILNIDIICGCSCEHEGNIGFESNSETCNGEGDLQCGICSCKNGKFGKFCECNGVDKINSLSMSCKPSNDTTEICTGRGQCICGKCECKKRTNPNEQYYGTYCECDNFSCLRNNGILCSGRGTCDCGNCGCNPGWIGPACECPLSNQTCVKPNDLKICSGNGECVCGICKCFQEPFTYLGKYCDECQSCPGQRCDEFKDCVECQAFKTGKYNVTECKQNCIDFQTKFIEENINFQNANENNFLKDTDWKICKAPVETNDCTIVFKYKYNTMINKVETVYVQKNKVCPEKVNVKHVIFGIVSTMVLCGIISLIIWKFVVEVHDRRQYGNFVKEQQKSTRYYDENPLFKSAVSTYINPTYKQS